MPGLSVYSPTVVSRSILPLVGSAIAVQSGSRPDALVTIVYQIWSSNEAVSNLYLAKK